MKDAGQIPSLNRPPPNSLATRLLGLEPIMKREPIDLSLGRPMTFGLQRQSQRTVPVRPFFAPAKAAPAAPEAFDEVFAVLAPIPAASLAADAAAAAKPFLNSASLTAVAFGLERQHERLASL